MMITNRKILYIEDNQKDQRILENFFESGNLPYVLTTVSSVSNARLAQKSTVFDLVLCEYLIEDLMVIDFVDDFGDIPFIILTKKGGESIAIQAFKSGAADYIIKDQENNYLSELPLAIDNVFQEREKEKEDQIYRKQLEEIVAERTHVLRESNQRLSDEVARRAQALEDLKESREDISSIFPDFQGRSIYILTRWPLDRYELSSN